MLCIHKDIVHFGEWSILAVYNQWTGGLDWTGLDWTGLDWTGLEWNGMDWTGPE